MTSNPLKRRERPSATVSLATLMLFAVASVLLVFSPVTALGQGMPPRGNTLMRVKPLTKPPLTDTQRLRQDIVSATNPVTGTINVRQLRTPESTRPDLQTSPNAVVTQYTAPASTRPNLQTIPNATVTQTTTPSSTRGQPGNAGSRQTTGKTSTRP
jgi:hypothetical protein